MKQFFTLLLAAWVTITLMVVGMAALAWITSAAAQEKPPGKPARARPWTVPLESLCRGGHKIYLDLQPGGYIRGPIEIWCIADGKPILRIKPGECFRMNGTRPEVVKCADG